VTVSPGATSTSTTVPGTSETGPPATIAIGCPSRSIVLEAMKMEHPALAAADGVVEIVHVEVGHYVEAHATLVTLAASTPPEEPRS
jgi:hypothetical protein